MFRNISKIVTVLDLCQSNLLIANQGIILAILKKGVWSYSMYIVG